MRIIITSLIAAATLFGAVPACAQEIIVTAARRAADGYNGGIVNGVVTTQRPIINLKRLADYVVQPVRLTGDTRDVAARKSELSATLRGMIAGAGKAGVELAIGDYVVEPLTVSNLSRLNFVGDGRPDTSTTIFLVKVKLTPEMSLATASAQIAKFVDSVNRVGRTTLKIEGDPTLSVVNPDQYRGQIADLIAADAAVMKVKFGPDYGVVVTGLDRPVEWARAGPLDVYLYLPSTYTVTKN